MRNKSLKLRVLYTVGNLNSKNVTFRQLIDTRIVEEINCVNLKYALGLCPQSYKGPLFVNLLLLDTPLLLNVKSLCVK